MNRVCIHCKEPKDESEFSPSLTRKRNYSCKPCEVNRVAEWRKKYPEKYRIQVRKYSQTSKYKYQRDYYYRKIQSDPVKMEARKQKCRVWGRKIKQRAFDRLGDRCACCGEARFDFLQIDHINNDGFIHRRHLASIEINGKTTLIGGVAHRFFRHVAEGYTNGLQLLCANCNFGKRVNRGVCPHEEERMAVALLCA